MKTENNRFHELKKAQIELRKHECDEFGRMSRIPVIMRVNIPYAIMGVCNSPPWRAGPDSG
jgi:hypothetical protein